MSTLKFFGNGAAAVGVILVHVAIAHAAVFPVDTAEARKGLGHFIQASLALTALGVAGSAVGASQRS